MPDFTNSDQKLAELILHVSHKCKSDSAFGATKLNKILYFSDFLAYARFGKAITDTEYQHLPQGPAPRRLLPVRTRLIEAGALNIASVDTGLGFTRKLPIPLRQPDLSDFSADEIALVDDVIATLAQKNATDVSNLSHLEFGWSCTKDGETIEYGTVFLSTDEPSEADLKWADQYEMSV